MRSRLVLVGEGFSPWTEKARWALDHQRLSYRYEEYTPLVGEPWLRVRARRVRGPISVPYLLGSGGLSIGDSFAIAREADRIGDGAPLVPADLLDAIAIWNERSERLMRAGRAQILARTEQSREVQMESLPGHLPRALRGVLAPSVRLGTAYLRKKYAVRPVPDEELEVDLAAIRAAIAGREAQSLLDRFTLADVAIATALQAVRPHRSMPRGLLPAQREAWARPALAARWEDVLAWRDAMIARHGA
ncbi:MAG: glutathione S-transferase N-terminal domain-containing protein [Labilithrix sp.]|nr:glutathione S-transferase N-terminal domain-containing protein [Labilithrix sp.]MCW5810806.1 glutathione S-transferase N-terminal domain-containing protein [Labilithrix sp.]